MLIEHDGAAMEADPAVELERLRAVNVALVEALAGLVNRYDGKEIDFARAALAQAKGEPV